MSSEKKRRSRRSHTPEFKAETVRLVREGGRSVAQLAQELGLADSLIRYWLRLGEVDVGKGVRRQQLPDFRFCLNR